MRFFKGYIATDLVGSECSFEFSVENDYNEEQIEEIAKELAFDYIRWGYQEIAK